MSKVIAKSITRSGKDLIFTTQASEYHLNLLLNELKDIDLLELNIKKHKESRSVRQNAYLWKLIEKISIEINGSKREDDLWNVYRDLLKRANVKHVILAAVKEAKLILEQNFRHVEELPNSMTTEKGKTLIAFKCYIGSSQFDTKEMVELLDYTLDYAHEVGVMDTEILSIKEFYKL